jgi:hypothetical protein
VKQERAASQFGLLSPPPLDRPVRQAQAHEAFHGGRPHGLSR